jgi:hypothetical protein
VFGANLDRDPLEPGAPRRQYGTAILSAWPLLASENILLPRARPDNEQRGLLVLDVDLDGEPFRLHNAHLGVSADERRLQVQAILDEVDRTSAHHALLGDSTRSGLPQAVRGAGEQCGAWRGRLGDESRRLGDLGDYVLVSPQLGVRRVIPDTFSLTTGPTR